MRKDTAASGSIPRTGHGTPRLAGGLVLFLVSALAGASANLPAQAAGASPSPSAARPATGPGLAGRLPPAPLPNIDTFMQIGSAGSPVLSPDGRRLFFTSMASGTGQIYRLLPNGWPYQLTFFPEGVDFSVFSEDCDFAVLGIDTGGNEQHQLHLLDTSTGEVRVLTDEPKVRHTAVRWSRDGRRIYFGANAVDPASFFIFEMDLTTGRSRSILERKGSNYVADESADGRELIIGSATSSLDNNFYLYNLDTRDLRLITPHTGEHSYWGGTLSADGREVYMVTDDTPDGVSRLHRVDLATLARSPLIREERPWELDTFNISEDRRYLAYVLNEEGYGRLHLLDLRTLRPIPVPEMNGIVSSPTPVEGGYLAFTFNSPTRAADIWIWRFAGGPGRIAPAGDAGAPSWGRSVWAGRTASASGSGALSLPGSLNLPDEAAKAPPDWLDARGGPVQVTFSSYAGVDPSIFNDPELVRYRSFDGTEIPAFLFLPPGVRPGQPIPFIIDVHGGPTAQFRPAFNRHFQYLMQHGFGIFAPNFRGSSGYGRDFEDADNYRKRLDSVKDVAAGAEWLISQGYSRRGLIGIKGGSYGGYMTLAAMTEYPDLFAAGIDQVGVANFESFLEKTADYRRSLRESEYGPLSDREFLRSISPLHKADRIRGALFVVHGANDPRVPVGEARQILSAVKAQGVPVDSLIFPDEGHGIAKRPNQLVFYRRMVEFFKTHLNAG